MEEPAFSEKGGNPWLDYICIETESGHTFDPIRYLVAAQEHGSITINGVEKTWEEIYSQDLSLVGYHLIGMEDAHFGNQSLIKATFRIAELLPIEYSDPSGQNVYGSRNGLLSTIFWGSYKRKDMDTMFQAYEQAKDIVCSQDRVAMDKVLETVDKRQN